MEIRIDDGGVANRLPAILIDGREAGRFVPTPTGFKARMTRWLAYDDQEFGNITNARAFFEREFADVETSEPAPERERTEIAVSAGDGVDSGPTTWILTADGREIGRLVPYGRKGALKAQMSLWAAYEGTTFADADTARKYFDTEFNGTPQEATP